MHTLLTREESEQREQDFLPSYATRTSETLGRLHWEEEHHLRTAFQRDRDRLIHSTAFRRLEYKTQVFINHEGDYYRTRLTHTLEVVQIARSLARFLRLNEDLAEAMALAHDLGHTPFGHAVEGVLNKLIDDEGGFEHNAQGLRVVDLLETPYPDYTGLNLTYEVRSIFTKKASLRRLQEQGFASPFSDRFHQGPSKLILEAQVVDLADGIAYNSHDVDDGVKSGLVSMETARRAVPLLAEVWEEARGMDDSGFRRSVIRELINRQVTDVAEESLKRIQDLDECPPRPPSDSPAPPPHSGEGSKGNECHQGEYPPLSRLEQVIAFSPTMNHQNQELRRFLRENLYQHPQVMRQMSRAQSMITCLFADYLKHPERMAPQFRNRVETESIKRVVCDYIAGMTDRFAEEASLREGSSLPTG